MPSRKRQAASSETAPRATGPEPAGPAVSNQAKLDELRQRNVQVGTGIAATSVANTLSKRPIDRWAKDQSLRAKWSHPQSPRFATNQGRAKLGRQLQGGQQALGTGLKVAGVASAGIAGATDSGVATPQGRTTNAVGQMGLNIVAGQAIHPAVSIIDAGISYGMQSPLGKNLPEEVRNTSLSGTLSNSVTAVSSLTEMVTTGETSGAETFHQESLSGQRGILSQLSSTAGEAIKSVREGDTASYVERAERGDFGIPGQFGNALGKGTHDLIFGDPEKVPEERQGIVPTFERARDALWGWFGGGK